MELAGRASAIAREVLHQKEIVLISRMALAVATSLITLAMAACGESPSSPADPSPAATEQPAGEGAQQPDAARDAVAALRRFTGAANRGDLEAVLAATARDVRFDSEGRIFSGEAGIREFIGGEVIAAGGRYRELSVRTQGARAVVEYDFRTSGGAREHFTYACSARRGRLTDCIGRYV